MASATGVGASVRRKEDLRFITGKGNYTDDITLKDQAHGYFLRSPHAHATIKSIDAAKAKKMPGVLGVFTGQEVVDTKLGGLICGWTITSKDGSPMKAGPHPVLAHGKVRFVGDQVALIVAETKEQAKAAAGAIKVSYEILPHVVDAAKAMKSKAQVHDLANDNRVYNWGLGNEAETNAAFKNAAHVTTLEIVNNRLIPNAMEPRAAIGAYDAGTENYTLYTTSQNPHLARLVIAAFNGLAPEHRLRVIAPDVGGGFGSKIFIYGEEVACVWASKFVGRPIKWVAERTESFLCDAHGRDHVTKAELAVNSHGKITGLRVHTIASMGAYLSTFSAVVPTYLYGTLLSGQYNIPAVYVTVDAVYTNTAPVDAYRGAGRPEATYVVERLVETAARELKQDPAEFRRKNFITSFPHQTPVIMCYDAGNYAASLDKALAMSDYKNFAQRKAASAKNGKLRGVGFSAYIEACGLAPSAAVGSLGAGVGLWESAEVRVNPTGSIEILTGSHSHGQGHETTFAQLVVEKFGVDINSVSVVHGDTDKVQFGMGTYGSRSAAVGMHALSKALDRVEAKAKKVAAHVMEASENDIVLKDGTFSVKGTDKTKAFWEIALQAYVAHKPGFEPGLKESAFHDPANFVFPSGVHICEVEVDAETGHTEVVAYTCVDDFGNLINPMIVEGQVHGGIAQGIGQALLEGAHYDDDSGQLLTGSYMDYAMPRARNMPDVANFKLGFTCTPCPTNPMGIKGCGEAGAIGSPPAVINAITNAIGVREITMPATSLTVWNAMQGTAMKKAAE